MAFLNSGIVTALPKEIQENDGVFAYILLTALRGMVFLLFEGCWLLI